MKRRDLLWLLLTTLIVTAAITVHTPKTTAQAITAISLDPLIIDTRNMKNVGDTFSINVTISNTNKLWGYQYSVFYNNSVINATTYDKLDDRFTKDEPSEIGFNYTAVARATYDSDPTGITSVAPLPVDRINFVVTGLGTTALTFDPVYSYLADVRANVFKVSAGNLLINNGEFSNTQTLQIHDVAVTDISASQTSGKPGDSITITTSVSNNGGYTENVTVTATYNATLTTKKQIGAAQTITNLAEGDNETLTFTWDTAGLKDGFYHVTVTADIPVDDKISDNNRIVDVTLASSGTGLPIQWILIGIGVVVVVIIVAVFALRARK